MDTPAGLKKLIEQLTERIAKLESINATAGTDHSGEQDSLTSPVLSEVTALSYNTLLAKAQRCKKPEIRKFLQEWQNFIPLEEICTIACLYDRKGYVPDFNVCSKDNFLIWLIEQGGCKCSTLLFQKIVLTSGDENVKRFFNAYGKKFEMTIDVQQILEVAVRDVNCKEICESILKVFPKFEPDWKSLIRPMCLYLSNLIDSDGAEDKMEYLLTKCSKSAFRSQRMPFSQIQDHVLFYDNLKLMKDKGLLSVLGDADEESTGCDDDSSSDDD